MDILPFMQNVYALPADEARKLKFLYRQCGISQRYSVIPDYSRPAAEWKFYPATENVEPFPSLEQRMAVYHKQAPALSVDAVRDCLSHKYSLQNISHLVTVSCTGMSAPGLDLQLIEMLDLNKTIFRTSINFMGCYAAIHALKIGDVICKNDPSAQVLIVCTELCTLHFQKEPTIDNMTSSLLFGDGVAAALLMHDEAEPDGLIIDEFYSEVQPKGKRDMAWELSSSGFLMTLSGYVPDLIEEDFAAIVEKAMTKEKLTVEDVSHWCIHPGGKKIIEAIHKSLQLTNGQLQSSLDVLHEFGNLSSATILFVLKKILHENKSIKKLFGAAFGPGLTVETFTAHN